MENKTFEKLIFVIVGLLFLSACNSPTDQTKTDDIAAVASTDKETTKTIATFYPEMQSFIAKAQAGFEHIPQERKTQLEAMAAYISELRSINQPVNLTFICTHNSRRSHMSQLWAAVGAKYYGIDSIGTFSGGTESTAFNPRAVAALQRAGFKIEKGDQKENPRYAVSYGAKDTPMVCFSKKFSDPYNPQKDFCAVMTCSHADQNCPFVMGATKRFAIPYEDPKVADNTDGEAAKYDERCLQIATEELYLFSKV